MEIIAPVITNTISADWSLVLDHPFFPLGCFVCIGFIGVLLHWARMYRHYRMYRQIGFAMPDKARLRDINIEKKYRKQLKKDSPELYLIIDHFCRQFPSTNAQEMSLSCELKARYTLQFYMNDRVVISDRELNAFRNLYRDIERITLTSEKGLLLTMIVQK
jgi:hypothetical protein